MRVISTVLFLFSFTFSGYLMAYEQGIYINQGTLNNNQKLNFLIQESKATGINTFIVDLKFDSRHYGRQIQKIKDNGIKYVARIVIFPKGGERHQVRSPFYWEKKAKLMDKAIAYGANEIQLDYIRYNTKQRPLHQNSKDIHEVIKYFKTKADKAKVPLQIDIFGEVSFGESSRIGQNIKLFAPSIDVASPMVYPSHYKPYKTSSSQPYNTVYKSIKALRAQFNNNPPFRLIPWIEATNFRYKMTFEKKIHYVQEQIRAAQVAGTHGFYVWSANNQYGALFAALKRNQSMVNR